MKHKLLNSYLVSLILAASCSVGVANAGLIVIQGTGLTGTDKIENFDIGALGNNVSTQFTGNGLTFNTISGAGVALTSNANCGNSLQGVTNQYLYAGLNFPCSGSSLTDSFSILFDNDVSELSWQGFNRAGGTGFTVTALLDNVQVSVIDLNTTNNFENQFMMFTGSNFNELRIIENGTSNLFFAMDNFAWNEATSQDVPEPSTLAIFALGMIGLASRRFKKQ